MGVGKTATGRALAEILGWDFLDLDEEIEQAAQKPIPRIFGDEGEDRFRDLESQELRKVLGRNRVVVATGGGVLLREENRKRLEGRIVVNLDASPEECARRLRNSSTERPLLAGPDPEEAARRVYEARRHVYGWVRSRVDTEGKTPAEVASEIAARFVGCSAEGGKRV